MMRLPSGPNIRKIHSKVSFIFEREVVEKPSPAPKTEQTAKPPSNTVDGTNPAPPGMYKAL